jgi:hypothetical protein
VILPSSIGHWKLAIIDDKRHHQRLMIYRMSWLISFAMPKHLKMKLHICTSSVRTCVKVVDALTATEGGHYTSQQPFLAIPFIVITGS